VHVPLSAQNLFMQVFITLFIILFLLCVPLFMLELIGHAAHVQNPRDEKEIKLVIFR
jgi:hypothetical protein